MADPTPTPFPPPLDLTTSQRRPTVRIDGRPYQLRTVNDLSWSDFTRVKAGIDNLRDLQSSDRRRKKAAQRLCQDLVALVLIAPPAVRAALGEVARVRILDFFMELLLPTAPSTARADAPKTGANSSRGSSASTAGTRSRGSNGSRSGTSAPVPA